ncbi:MAG: SPOR domain-containing protein [Bacteroidales bacterium]|nr:SPOR domain-containing protein [Bacteroidales bacterium]
MKKLLILTLVSAIFFAIGCKEDNPDDPSALTPSRDTNIYPGYEEFYTDESNTDSLNNANNTGIDTTVNNDDVPVMVEDTVGNIQPATNTDIDNSGRNFYIIVGSYQNVNNAKIREQYFKNQGYTAEVLPKFGVYNRVSVAKFNQENSAREELKKLRTKYNDNSFWLLLR